MHGVDGGLRFGVFLAPYHRSDQNPTLSLERDLELAELLESLGYNEIWYGEHHSDRKSVV